MNGRIAMFPGSFDPPTNGHLNIIERASRLYEKFYVVVADNIYKKCLFTVEERVEMLKENLSQYDNIEIKSYQGLMVDFARKAEVDVMIRGIRSLTDFSIEFDLAVTNKQLLPSMETLLIPTEPNFYVLRSSAIKELATFGGDVSTMVPQNVARLLREKYPYCK